MFPMKGEKMSASKAVHFALYIIVQTCTGQ